VRESKRGDRGVPGGGGGGGLHSRRKSRKPENKRGVQTSEVGFQRLQVGKGRKEEIRATLLRAKVRFSIWGGMEKSPPNKAEVANAY